MRALAEPRPRCHTCGYSIFDHVGDMVALVASLQEKQAIIVGHDWVRPSLARGDVRPDVFTPVAG